MTTKEKALEEAASWKVAQELMFSQRPTIDANIQGVRTPGHDHVIGSSCYTDGSWTERGETCGVGWVLQNHRGDTEMVGLKGFIRSFSPLHAELYGLIFAMQNLQDPRHNCRTFYTDCKDLLSMVSSPHLWPTFFSELETLRGLQGFYPDYTLRYAARERNRKTDLLTRSARSRNLEFQYISSSIPTWVSDTRVFVTG